LIAVQSRWTDLLGVGRPSGWVQDIEPNLEDRMNNVLDLTLDELDDVEVPATWQEILAVAGGVLAGVVIGAVIAT
jgi:hypothetical protein